MKQGELDDAKREALNALDEWNDVSCVAPRGTGYYYELQGVIEDAVETGAKHNQGKCPSKAEVAREFVEAMQKYRKYTQSRSWVDAIKEVLKEWEDAEK